MGAETNIEWCDHTFNPWRGCTKVSPGCANCYAETMSKRNPRVLGTWGKDGARVAASESYWRQPIAWDKAAAAAGERHRVFCASLADVFEDREDLLRPLARLLALIDLTPHLDWLLLTKRPHAWRSRLQGVLALGRPPGLTPQEMVARRAFVEHWLEGKPPSNVWIGTSVENQAAADERIPHLLKIPAAVRFLSCEPLLGPVDLEYAFWLHDENGEPCGPRCLKGGSLAIPWAIVGGESGPGARPCDVAWIASLVGQCEEAGAACFVKQLGSDPYEDLSPQPAATLAREHGVGPVVTRHLKMRDKKGGDPDEWPGALRVRQFPEVRR